MKLNCCLGSDMVCFIVRTAREQISCLAPVSEMVHLPCMAWQMVERKPQGSSCCCGNQRADDAYQEQRGKHDHGA